MLLKKGDENQDLLKNQEVKNERKGWKIQILKKPKKNPDSLIKKKIEIKMEKKNLRKIRICKKK